MINCFWISLSFMNSSKVRTNFSLSKKVVLCLGEAFCNTGGILSRGPPVGAPRLAQYESVRARLRPSKKRKKVDFISDKITTYSHHFLHPMTRILSFDFGATSILFPQFCKLAPVVMISSTSNQCGFSKGSTWVR